MVAGLAWPASAVLAEDSSVAGAALSSPVNGYSPKLSYSMSQIVRLSQAKVSDDIMMAFIRNSENGHGLDADQVIYLRQHGISDPVILTMLNCPKPAEAVPATPPAQQAIPAIRHTLDPTVTSSPQVMDDQIELTPAHWDYSPHCYSDFGSFPAVALSFKWVNSHDGSSDNHKTDNSSAAHSGDSDNWHNGNSGSVHSGSWDDWHNGNSDGGHGGGSNGLHTGGANDWHGRDCGGGHGGGSGGSHSGGSGCSHGDGSRSSHGGDSGGDRHR